MAVCRVKGQLRLHDPPTPPNNTTPPQSISLNCRSFPHSVVDVRCGVRIIWLWILVLLYWLVNVTVVLTLGASTFTVSPCRLGLKVLENE